MIDKNRENFNDETPEPDPTPTPANNRRPNGTFAPGNKVAHGNPWRMRSAMMKRAFMDAVTEDDMRAIAKKMVELAKQGDVVAAKLVLERTCGKIEVSNEDDADRPALPGMIGVRPRIA